MLKNILFFIVLIAGKATCHTCDSTIVVYHTNHDQFVPITFVGLQVDSLINGKITQRYFSDGSPTIRYEYDSLGRLISQISDDSIVFTYDSFSRLMSVDYFLWNSTSWEYKQDTSRVNYYYSGNRLDSTVKSLWNGSGMIPFYRAIYSYSVTDTLYQINVLRLDTSASWYVDTLVSVSYTPLRTDSLYANGVFTTYPDEIRTYDSLERILNIREIIFGNSNKLQYFSYQCNQLANYAQTYFGSHNSFNTFITFDSLCRIKKIVTGNYHLTGSNTEDVYEYYYTSCNTMVVRADEDIRICEGDTAELSLMHFGGTPPFRIDWNPNTVFPNDSSTMIYAAPDSSIDYFVTVTDSNGLAVTDTISVHVSNRPVADIYISAIDTNSVCQSATLKTDSLQGVFYSWSEAASPVTLSNFSGLDIIYNGTYRLVAQENAPYYLTVCPLATDSFVFNYFSNPAPQIDVSLECDVIVAHSTENLDYQWYKSNLLMPDSINDTLSVNQFGAYYAIGVDSAGCLSAQSQTIIFQSVTVPLSLIVNIGHPTCDSCSDGYVNVQGVGGASSGYTYTINGVLMGGTFQDSLPAGLYEFCVTDRNNCVFCLSSVYISIDELERKKIIYYPNPLTDVLNVSFPFYKQSSKTEFLLSDASGRIVRVFTLKGPDFTLRRESLPGGIYFFSIREDGVVRDRGKILIN